MSVGSVSVGKEAVATRTIDIITIIVYQVYDTDCRVLSIGLVLCSRPLGIGNMVLFRGKGILARRM